VRQTAKANQKCRFSALLHHVTLDLLRQSYFWLKRNAAAGVDGVTWRGYGDGLRTTSAIFMLAFIVARIELYHRDGG